MKTLAKIFTLTLFFTTTLLQAEHLYTANDFGTLLFSERSEAKSLNKHGSVVGKFFKKDHATDFLWTPESGIKVLTNEADNEIFPKINDIGNVVGCVIKRGSWLSSDKIHSYTSNTINGFKLHKSMTRDNGASIFLNNNLILLSNHVNPYKATSSTIASNDNTFELTSSSDLLKCFPTAINNKWKVLVTADTPGIFSTGIWGTYFISVYDLISGEHAYIAKDKPYFGRGINDDNMVIAQDRDGKEGFYGTLELGMISLGKFIPSAINNHGDIVGKSGNEIFLKRSNGDVVDLNAATNRKEIGIERITDVYAINDAGQILVSAKISKKSHAFLLTPIE